MGYHQGFSCEDCSLSAHSTRRRFQCKVCLLYINGDYPALAKMTGFTHAGGCCCHWCLFHNKKDMAINRINAGGFRRWLPARSVHRAAGGNLADAERRPPPPRREHRASVRTGVLASNHSGPQTQHPQHSTGICEWCPLVAVPNYNIIDDANADFMHAVMWLVRHMIPAMKGETPLAKPVYLKVNANPNTETEMQECTRRLQENERRREANSKAREVNLISNYVRMLQMMCCYYTLCTAITHYVLLIHIMCC